MALKPASAVAADRPPAPPAWLVPAYLGSLVLVLVGERVLAATQTPRNVATGLGVVGAVGAVALMARVALGARSRPGPDARERASIYTLLAGLGALGLVSIACALALTETGLKALGAATMTPEARARLVGILRALVVLTASGSVLPLVFGDRALAPMRHAPLFEARRVRAAIVSGATLALAAAYCSLFVLSSGAIEKKLDFSHFRTGRPSDSTKNVAKGLPETVRVLSFFPPSSEIGAEVRGYLQELAQASGGKVELELYDRLLEPGLARDAKVTQDGVVVLLRGAQRESVTIGNDPKTAPNKLKNLDQDVQKALIKVLRSQRTAYFTVGHGEVNEAASRDAAEGRSVKTLRRILESQNYLVKDLGLAQGLGSELPKDAYVVFVLGPQKALMPEELSALGGFLRKGGKLFVALDPEAQVAHGPLAGVLGLTYSGVPLAHDKIYAARRRTAADKGILVTTRFSSHASVSTLSRNAQKAPLIFPGVTSLDKAEAGAFKVDFIVKSMPDTFEDPNQSYEADQGEKRAVFNLAAAVSVGGDEQGDKAGKGASEGRAIAVGDVDVVTDAVFGNDPNLVFALDTIRWLGGEESFAGAVASAEDVAIEHTKQKDQLWFYGVIFVAPGTVLGVGLFFARASTRTRRRGAPTPPTPAPPRARGAATREGAPDERRARADERPKRAPSKQAPNAEPSKQPSKQASKASKSKQGGES